MLQNVHIERYLLKKEILIANKEYENVFNVEKRQKHFDKNEHHKQKN